MKQIKKNFFEIEINGLRGLAILLVVLFHYEIYPFSGGFIGVDIFFVISGYLIGKIIENKNLNFLNYKEFLFKRVKRIFPGLFFLLIISFIFFSFLLSPEHLIEFSKSLISNLLLIPNFYFWTESNYFDVSSNYKPLLHTWSLGVEYHFYLIWPFLVWIIKDLFKDKFFLNLFFIVFIIFSLFFNLYIISFGPIFEK
jgi:peptidoglycan/LPS O-acetylase OafA/YrhL